MNGTRRSKIKFHCMKRFTLHTRIIQNLITIVFFENIIFDENIHRNMHYMLNEIYEIKFKTLALKL